MAAMMAHAAAAAGETGFQVPGMDIPGTGSGMGTGIRFPDSMGDDDELDFRGHTPRMYGSSSGAAGGGGLTRASPRSVDLTVTSPFGAMGG
eukprot:CAMPEP_0203823530 /NCGR_PEP_ID=MMETSP0115-20131106/49433_1 /ASSEMBLY_ACC=CAM_ASM_000227 /TAXON_ID=33651 /ORGANISM="Bicosoecid sp, Strain ms1" /LENGTH=90 /DNA_ID=CAMNT_0050732567 /DNA_START=16 /DNA_END=285 /DNA_ORIENTATION=+